MNTLIGYNGFIGKNLINKEVFKIYNSKTIHDLSKDEHETIFCAAPSAEKWKINISDKEDIKNIEDILKNLQSSNFKKIVLFSSIDVYDDLNGLNEEYEPISHLHNYGKNRLFFEKEIKKFDNWTIIRLPGLFGVGLKKNVIFDLMFNNVTSKINLNDKYQWYDLDWLHDDVSKILNEKNKIFNFFTEPIENKELISRFFQNSDKSFFIESVPFKSYNLKTLNNESGYIKTKEEIFESLNLFINKTLKTI